MLKLSRFNRFSTLYQMTKFQTRSWNQIDLEFEDDYQVIALTMELVFNEVDYQHSRLFIPFPAMFSTLFEDDVIKCLLTEDNPI